jgi:hypothetical protein
MNCDESSDTRQNSDPMTNRTPDADHWTRSSDELPIVLTGGPADGHWYHHDDFTQRQTAARRMAAVHHRTPGSRELATPLHRDNDFHQPSPRSRPQRRPVDLDRTRRGPLRCAISPASTRPRTPQTL